MTRGAICDVSPGKGHEYRPILGRWVEGTAEFHLAGKLLIKEEETHRSPTMAFLLLLMLDVEEE